MVRTMVVRRRARHRTTPMTPGVVHRVGSARARPVPAGASGRWLSPCPLPSAGGDHSRDSC
ncbi:hypothetical protein SSCG_01847 [Streptomyces clavuligerus]|nr:hypothetical protein SSCG_01847 [Streptomyces clavuligerus]